MAYYTFHNKKNIFEAFKALYEALSGCRDRHEPQGLKLMRFYFKDKWRNKKQDSISTAVHPGPELSSSSRAQAVRRGPPHGPSVPRSWAPLTGDLTAPGHCLCAPQGTDSAPQHGCSRLHHLGWQITSLNPFLKGA